MNQLNQLLTAVIAIILWSLSLTTFLILGTLFIALSLVIHPRFLWRFAQYMCKVSLLMMGQRVTIRGTFPPRSEGPYIYIFNHTSLIDTFVLFAVLPEFTGAVGKAEQFRLPLWGWILRRWGAIPIERAQLSRAIASINRASEAVSGGLSLLISPEGTRSPDGELQPFKKGPFHIAFDTSAPLVPLIIRGAYTSKNRKSWIVRPGRIIVEVAHPLTPLLISYESVEALHRETHETFQSLMSSTPSS